MAIDVTLMAAPTRFVVAHLHIFKNAGSTIEHILEREFPASFARLHGPNPESTLEADDLAAFLRDHPGVQAVTSHHLRYPLPTIPRTVFFDCCFLRHPLERLDSMYSYFQKIDSTDAMSRSARRQTSAEFIRSLMARSPHLISNVQVTQLARGGAFTRPANEFDLENAVRIVRNMALPGVVEMFAESMAAAEYYIRPAFPNIKLGASPKNVSRPIVSSASEREQRLVRLWGLDLHRQVTKMNELDIELFRQAQLEIRGRLSLMPESQPEAIPSVQSGLRQLANAI